MAKSFGISFSIGALLNPSVNQAFASVNDKMRALSSSMARSKKNAAALGNVVAKRRELDDAIQRTKSGDSRAAGQISRLAAAYANAARKAGVYGQSLSEVIKRQQEFTAEAKRASRMANSLQTLQAGKQGLNQAQDSRKNAISGLVADAGTVMTLAAPLKTGLEFETGMSKVKAISGAQGPEFDALTAKARELGATTVWSAKEAAEGMSFLAMAGFKTNDVLAAMPGMLDLATAGGMDLGATADIASNILSGFGMEASKMDYVGDVLAKTFTNSNTSIAMLGESFKYCASVAKSAGQSFQDVAAMIGKLGDAGIQGSMAGTGLNAIIGRMAKPPQEAATALKKLGVSVADAKGKMRALPDVFADVEKAMGKFSEKERIELAKALYGAEHFGKGMVLQSVAINGSLQKMSAGLYEQGKASQVARDMSDNFAGDLKALNSAAEEVAICLYDAVSPALRQITQGIIPIVQSIGQWITANPRLMQGLVLLGGGFMALKTGAFVFTMLNSYRRTFQAGLMTMRGGASVAISGVLNSFGRLRAELGRPVNINSGSFRTSLTTMQNGLGSLRQSVRRTITSLGQITPASIGAGIKAAASGTAAAAGRVGWNSLRLGIKGVGIAFKTALGPIGLITTALTFGVEAIIEHWDKIEPYFIALWEGVKKAFSAALAWLEPIFNKITGFISPIVNGVKKVGEVIGKGWDFLFGSKKTGQEAPLQPENKPAMQANPVINTAIAVKPEIAPVEPVMAKMSQPAPARTTGKPTMPVMPEKPAPPVNIQTNQKEIIQPQVNVSLSITQNGIPEQSFASGVMSAIRSRQAELESIISGIVNEQARLAYGS